MYITYRDKKTGIVTRAYFERHTMTRTMRRYAGQEVLNSDFTPKPLQLAGTTREVWHETNERKNSLALYKV